LRNRSSIHSTRGPSGLTSHGTTVAELSEKKSGERAEALGQKQRLPCVFSNQAHPDNKIAQSRLANILARRATPARPMGALQRASAIRSAFDSNIRADGFNPEIANVLGYYQRCGAGAPRNLIAMAPTDAEAQQHLARRPLLACRRTRPPPSRGRATSSGKRLSSITGINPRPCNHSFVWDQPARLHDRADSFRFGNLTQSFGRPCANNRDRVEGPSERGATP
jgi:hypothetical protein